MHHFFRTMGLMTQYDLVFKGLKEGFHEFGYNIEDKFFDHFEQGMVSVGCLEVKVILEKRSTFLKLSFTVKGWVELTCDRCLEIYRQPVVHKDEIFVKFGETDFNGDDEVLWVLPGEHKLNLAQLIFEFIIVSIPLKHVHPVEKNGKCGCNTEMIDKINQYSQQGQAHLEIDPRWEALKKIKN